MAAADPVLPPEEVALLELGKVTLDAPLDKVPPAPDEHLGDPNATLPWDRCQQSARGQPEPEETKRRSSPEGGREDSGEAALTCPPAEAEDDEAPGLPVMAAHVFVPIDPRCIERTPGRQKQQPAPWPREEGKGGCVPPRDRPDSLRQKQPFVAVGPSRYRDPLGFEGRVAKAPDEVPRCPCATDCGAGSLKAVASVVGALFLCPCLVYGAYVFLPFDAPLLPTVSARLVYTLRCAAFATFPIVLGERTEPFVPSGGCSGGSSAETALSSWQLRCFQQEQEFPSSAPTPLCLSLFLPQPQRGFTGCQLSPSPLSLPPRDDRQRHLPPLFLRAGALWGAAAGGGDPPHLRLPVHPPLHPLLLQHGRAGHLPPAGAPQARPPAHGALCHLPVSGSFSLPGLRRCPGCKLLLWQRLAWPTAAQGTVCSVPHPVSRGGHAWQTLTGGQNPQAKLSRHPSALPRLIYWVSYAIGRSFRAFGFSVTFLPLVAMLLWNLYSMFVVEPENLLAVATPKPEDPSKESRGKLRFWG